jgi:bifunctional DNA-binding transcriptional regulator/antitoxin component of YhaV-PrlF toxin-antitoxin module
MVMERLQITAEGQMALPAEIRERWKTSQLVAEDRGDHLILRPFDPIELARGALKNSSGPSTDEMTRMNREEEQEIEDRKYGPDPG